MPYIKLEDLQKFPIRKDHYDREHGNEHFIYGVESVLEYAEYLPTYNLDSIFVDIKKELYSKFPSTLRPIQIGGRFIGNSYELGQEKMLYEVLELIDNIEKKYHKDCRTCKHLVSCEPNTSGNYDCWEADTE
jgi:hypothetical protein